MLGAAKEIYFKTRKRHDQIFNTYFMRPIAAAVVAVVAKTPVTPNQLTILGLALLVCASALFIALPSYEGGLIGIFVLELSYLFDCVDGMLARHKKLASKQGHLFDFFTDELKAVLLVGSLGVRAFRAGGLGYDASPWQAGDDRFLLAAIAAVVIVASATSLTNFVRRPELTGQETPVEAHYETVGAKKTTSIPGLVMMFLQFFNHYPSHLWLFAIAGHLEVFFWLYALNNLLYLGRGWLGLLVRFGIRGS